MLRSMVLLIKRTLTLWSEAMHLRPKVHRSGETTGDGYQRIPGIQLPGEYNHHVLVDESVAGFVAPALVDVSAQFVGP